MICAIYARRSQEQNGLANEAKSVQRQIDNARAYATRKGWRVAEEHIYSDDGISGAEFKTRPGYLRLMNALTPRPPFQALIMSEESRLGREQIETSYALKQLVTAGVRVFFYLEDKERTLDSRPTSCSCLSPGSPRRWSARRPASARRTRCSARRGPGTPPAGGRLATTTGRCSRRTAGAPTSSASSIPPRPRWSGVCSSWQRAAPDSSGSPIG